MKTVKHICPILEYTNLTNDKSMAKGVAVHIDKFKADILVLLEKGYLPISLQKIAEANNLNNALPDKSFCIVLSGDMKGIINMLSQHSKS